jgi:hypothetical protein
MAGTIKVGSSGTLLISTNSNSTFSGTGVLEIDNSGTIDIQSGSHVSQSVTFNGIGTLKLDATGLFTGKLVGLTAGDTIDFVNDPGATASLSGTTLTVTHTGGATETFTLGAPLPSGDFVQVLNDGHGGSEVVVSSVPPPTPAAATDSSVVNGYVNAANDTSSQLITGTSQPGTTVSLYDNGVLAGSAGTNAQGQWGYVVGHLADGAHSFTAKATDTGGHVSGTSTALNFTVDTGAPSAPSALGDSAIVNGYVNAAHDTAAQALTGTAEANSKVTIYDGTTLLGMATASGAGAWSYTLGVLATGPHSLTATATDAAGNTGVASSALAFTVDTIAPLAPTGLGDTAIANDYVNLVHDTAAQALTGTAENGSTVTVYDGTTLLGTAIASSTGAWSYSLGTLADGSHSLTATATDAAGNTGVASAALGFTVDTQAPVAPTALADASIANGYVNLVHDTAAQALTGTAENCSTVTVYDGTTLLRCPLVRVFTKTVLPSGKARASWCWQRISGAILQNFATLKLTEWDLNQLPRYLTFLPRCR